MQTAVEVDINLKLLFDLQIEFKGSDKYSKPKTKTQIYCNSSVCKEEFQLDFFLQFMVSIKLLTALFVLSLLSGRTTVSQASCY